MNTPQHTPGPWLASRLASPDYAPQYGIYSESNPNDFAIVKGDNAEANARLIASAPDLLEALENAVVLVHRMAHEQRRTFLDVEQAKAALPLIRAAIARATT